MTVIDQQTEPRSGPHGSSTRAWLGERISSETGAAMGATWVVLFFVAMALEPTATGSEPVWAVALSVAFLGVVGVTAVGFVARRRWALLASVAAAGLLTALSVACPITGHHPLGAWWFGQMACALVLLGASAYALGRPAAHR